MPLTKQVWDLVCLSRRLYFVAFVSLCSEMQLWLYAILSTFARLSHFMEENVTSEETCLGVTKWTRTDPNVCMDLYVYTVHTQYMRTHPCIDTDGPLCAAQLLLTPSCDRHTWKGECVTTEAGQWDLSGDTVCVREGVGIVPSPAVCVLRGLMLKQEEVSDGPGTQFGI